MVELNDNFGPLSLSHNGNGIGHDSRVPLFWEINQGKANQGILGETYSGGSGRAETKRDTSGRR